MSQTTQQQSFYGPLSGTTWVSRYQKKHSPTDYPDHPIFISYFQLPQSIASSLFNFVLGNLFAKPLSKSSLVNILVWSPPPHIPYISSPSQYLLFATHAHDMPISLHRVFVFLFLYKLCLSASVRFGFSCYSKSSHKITIYM